MILKTIKKKTYEIENSTEKRTNLETRIYSNIDYIGRDLPLDREDGISETITLHLRNGNELSLALRILEGKVWVDNFNEVYLMNDEGKTIERII